MLKTRRELLRLLREKHPHFLELEEMALRLRLEESRLREELGALLSEGLAEEEGKKVRITPRGIKRLAEEERKELLEELRKTVGSRKEWEERESLLRYRFWGWVLENVDRIRGELEDPRLSARYRLLLRALELSVGVERAFEGERSPEELLESFNELVEELKSLKEQGKVELPKLVPLSRGKEPRTYGLYTWGTDEPVLELLRFWLGKILTLLLLELE
jgi:hypothetical protein